MAGDHVHQESQCERDGPEHECRDELDRRDHDVEGPRDTGGEERVLEERARVLADARVDEGDVRGERQDQGQSDDRRAGDVEERHDAREVHEDDEEEHRHEQRQEAPALALAERC